MPNKGYKKTEEHKSKAIKTLSPFQFKKGHIGIAGFKGRNHTVESKMLIGIAAKNAHKGEYKTDINTRLRNSKEYKLWRISVFERDNYTCIWCGNKKEKLNADHIKSFAHYPELRFAIDNGRTLCVSCHKTTDTWCSRTPK